MTLSTNFIGSLIGRHLKHNIGLQSYDAWTGRGYVFSSDGRVGFFVDFKHADGPKYAVSYSTKLSSTDLSIRKSTADQFVAGKTGYGLPSTDAPSTSKTSLFYKAFDARIEKISTSSLGTVLNNQGLTAHDFSNTAMIVESWISGVLDMAPTSDMSANSGIRGFIAGVGGPSANRTFKTWTEKATTDSGENVLLTNPENLTTTQKNIQLDGKMGFDYLNLYFIPNKKVSVNFSDVNNQTLTYGNVVLKMKNFEGADLTDFDDTFIGSATDNTIFASKGNDTINGGGKWNADGTSTDRDWVNYANGSAGITLKTSSKGNMTVTDYGGGIDKLKNVEGVGGTYFADKLSGGTGNFNQLFSGLKGADIIDGGGGRDDRVVHGDDPSGVVVNLSAKSVNTQSVKVIANSIKTAHVDGSIGSIIMMKEALDELEAPAVKTVAANRALDGWGDLDTLINIEAASGSQFNDQLYGSNARNLISGNDGTDYIVGNGGDDYLVGGMGHDFLHGGLGRDWIVMDELNWGKLTQQGTNQTYNYAGRYVRDWEQSGNLVIYKSIHESTVRNSDVLDGFMVGDDLIDLTAIDANTKRAGNQKFDENIVRSFTNKAGQLKISAFSNLTDNHNYAVSNATGGYKLSGTELQGDVNGDGVADFAIKLVGVTINSQLPINLADSILF